MPALVSGIHFSNMIPAGHENQNPAFAYGSTVDERGSRRPRFKRW
jgi:hypothetical protein